jgi:putative CRISPR-associated protein (TIGR02619 family)
MARTILLPVGLSVLRKLEKEYRIHLNRGHEAAQLTANWVESLGNAIDDLSAELSTLKELKASSGDEAIFLATDTAESESAARANARIAELRFQITSAIQRIKSIVLDDAKKFREQGVRELISALDDHVRKAENLGRKPILSVSGGIKSVVPYIALYGMLRQLPVTYTFELTRELVYLPPLPVSYDWDVLKDTERVLREINEEVAISYDRLRALLGENYSRLEGLFQELDEDQMTLSAFGFMLLGDLERASQTPILLSPSAEEKLRSLQGIQRKQIESYLDQLRNPLMRAHKIDPWQRTDLDVYKPGNTGPRLAYFKQDKGVYVAEIYPDHNEYIRDLQNRRKADYDLKAFTPYWRTEPSAEEEALGADIIAIAEREINQANDARAKAEEERNRAQAELEEALGMATKTEAALNEMRQEATLLCTQVAELERERQARSSWGLWRRLRWVITKRA